MKNIREDAPEDALNAAMQAVCDSLLDISEAFHQMQAVMTVIKAEVADLREALQAIESAEQTK